MAEEDGAPVGADQLMALALTGYGHFTTMRVEDHRVRGLYLHLDRLSRDCRALFGAELDPDQVREAVRRSAPPTGTALVRVTVFDPALDVGRPAAVGQPQVLVTARPPSTEPAGPLRVKTRLGPRYLPQVKSVAVFGQLFQRRAAQTAGFDDALLTDAESLVCEGCTWNIGFCDGDRVLWPQAPALPGVTMRLLKAAREHQERPVRLADLPGFDAAFAVRSTAGVQPISQIDDHRLAAEHPVIAELSRAYLDIPLDPL